MAKWFYLQRNFRISSGTSSLCYESVNLSWGEAKWNDNSDIFEAVRVELSGKEADRLQKSS